MKNKHTTIKGFFINPITIIVSIVLVVSIIGSVFGVVAYNNYKEEERIAALNSELSETATVDEESTLQDKLITYDSFNNEERKEYFEDVNENYEKSLTSMKNSIISDFEDFIKNNVVTDFENTEEQEMIDSVKNSKDFLENFDEETNNIIFEDEEFSSCVKEINDSIYNIKSFFMSKYDSEIKSNTINNVDKVNDKNKLEKAVKNLGSLKDSIEKNSEIFESIDEVIDEHSIADYNSTIDSLIKSYKNRISELEKIEEEERAREAAEREQENYYSNTTNNSNSGGGSSSDNSSGSSTQNSDDINSNSPSDLDHGGLRKWRVFDDGLTIYYYNDGYAITSEGYEFNWIDMRNGNY